MSGVDKAGESSSSSSPSFPKNQEPATTVTSKFRTDCSAEHRASLECISANYETKDEACAEFFEKYKQCRKAENERRLEANQFRFWRTKLVLFRVLLACSIVVVAAGFTTGVQGFAFPAAPCRHDRRRWTSVVVSLAGERGTSSSSGPRSSSRRQRRRKKPRLGLLTFDLDDTLFPTQAVVQHANNRMIEFLNRQGYGTTSDDFFKTTRTLRRQLEAEGKAVSYTDLRKKAIEMELQRISLNPYRDYADLVEEAYATWEHERHAAAEYYMSPVVVDVIQDIRRHFGASLCIAAITNGKGNPVMMPSLRQFFSFCISGEDEGVFPHRKPHPKIFETAVHRFRTEHYAPSDESDDEDVLWCHVGDCLVNDVAASADCGAFAVWYCPDPGIVQTSLGAASGGASANALGSGKVVTPQAQPPLDPPTWSTATQDEIDRRNEMASQAQEKVAAHIYHLSQLMDVLKQVARPDRQARLQRRRQTRNP